VAVRLLLSLVIVEEQDLASCACRRGALTEVLYSSTSLNLLRAKLSAEPPSRLQTSYSPHLGGIIEFWMQHSDRVNAFQVVSNLNVNHMKGIGS